MTAVMVTEPQWAVECDRCYRRGPFHAAQRGAKDAAFGAGWFISPSAPVKDLCPDCCTEMSTS